MPTIILLSSLLLLVSLQSWPEPGQVVSSIDKTADFSSVRTYAWERGIEVADREAHKLVVAAIEAELSKRGMRLVESTSADIIVRYDALSSTPANLDELQRTSKKDPNAVAATKVLGSLAISTHRNRSPNRMWLGHARDVVDTTPAGREAAVRKIVARVFETYPIRATP